MTKLVVDFRNPASVPENSNQKKVCIA